MKTFIKKAVVMTLAVAMFGVFAMPASGQTVDELQAQIAALLAQIQALQVQLNQVGSGGSGSGSACYSWTRDLTLRSTGADVQALQQFLNGQGYAVASSGVGSAGNETEYFGSLTQSAMASFQAAKGINPPAGYFGPITRSYITANLCIGGGGDGGTTPIVVPGGYSLAYDNPASQILPKGATGVVFMKFSAGGTGTIESLTFKRVGLGSTSDITGLYLYDGSERLTSSKTLNSTTHQVFFPNLALSVSGSRTLSLVADIYSGATPNDINGFELIAATGDFSLPTSLGGNQMTIGGQAVGTITVNNGAAPSNPRIGQTDALVANVVLSAGTGEDVEIHRISLTEGGSINNSYLNNFEFKYAGDIVATASTVGSKDLVTLEFSTPFLLEKGQEKTLKLYADVGGSSRAADTIVFYMDSSADIVAVGKTYGYAVTPTISSYNSSSGGDTLTLQGAQVTITFNGPTTGDIAKNGQDVNVFDFNIAAQNNIEIRNLRFSMATTALITGEGFNDFKVWDVAASAVVTSSVDVTTTTTQVFTDTITLNANESKNFKVTVDVDPQNDNGDSITVTLVAFGSNDIRNLDNNTYVSTSDIVGDAAAGNAQSTLLPAVDIQLAASPNSQTYVQGSQNLGLVGISFRAIADQVRLDSVKVYATATGGGTLTTSEIRSLGLYDGTTLLSDLESLDSSLTVTFDNLDYSIAKGATKVLTVKGSIAADATSGDDYYVYLNALTDVTAYDTQGNSVTQQGTTANSGGSVVHAITTAGAITVVTAPDDSDSKSQIIVAGEEQILAKYRFTSADEGMTINKMQLLVNNSDVATATSTAAADESPTLKLYVDGSQIGASGGYTVTASGNTAGVAYISDLGWYVAKDTTKTLVVKGSLNTIAGGADTGNSVWVHVVGSGGPGYDFEAVGSTNKDTTISAASGKEMVVYKTEPILTVANVSGATLAGGGAKAIMEFSVAANAKEQVSFKMFTLNVSVQGATITMPTISNVVVRDLSTSEVVVLGTTTSDGTDTVGGTSDQFGIYFTTEQVISAGDNKTYRVSFTFENVSATAGNAAVSTYLLRNESTKVAATDYASVVGAAAAEDPSFVWSDNSAIGHTESTLDWANGFKVATFPSETITVTN